MLYPKCPRCGGKSESNESPPDWTKVRGPPSTVMRNAHPALKAIGLGLTVAKGGYEVWKRLPRVGGNKKCTICGHHFS
jgi:hypothetical protein